MAAAAEMTVTILDLPEVLEILHEAIDAVPDWERKALLDRLNVIMERANHKRKGRP